MSFFCREETSSGVPEPEGEDGVSLREPCVGFNALPLAGSEVGKGADLSLDARSSNRELPSPLTSVAVSSLDLLATGNAGSGSFFDGPARFDLPRKLDSRAYFCADSSTNLCSFSFKKPLHSVPPCPSKTPK